MSGSLFPRSLWKQLFPRILWEQTTFYNSAPYYGRLHYSRLCLRIAEICMVLLHMVLHTWTTAAEPLISSSAVVQEGSPTDL